MTSQYDYLKYAHEHMVRMQSFSEAKNAAVVTASLILISNTEFSGVKIGALVTQGFAVLLYGIAILFAAMAIYPNLKDKSNAFSALYFLRLSELPSGKALLEKYRTSPEDFAVTELANQLVSLSDVVLRKMQLFKVAMTMLFCGAVFHAFSAFLF